LAGGEELLDHAQSTLGCSIGGTSADGMFTLEEAECLADCNIAPCVQVNHRFVRTTTPETFDQMIGEIREGRRDSDIPPHGTLIRVRRNGVLRNTREALAAERAVAGDARDARKAQETK
jgi:hypothetical protein